VGVVPGGLFLKQGYFALNNTSNVYFLPTQA
jgi:hypothetical protein